MNEKAKDYYRVFAPAVPNVRVISERLTEADARSRKREILMAYPAANVRIEKTQRLECSMEYEINLVNMDRELADGHYKASIVYTFTISNGLATTHGDVVLTDAGAEIIEQKGKDPQAAAKIALERYLKDGRDPFESQIFLRVPVAYAEYFSENGSYEPLPSLTD